MSGKVEYGFAIEAKGVTPSTYQQVHSADFIKIESSAHSKQLQANPPKADAAITEDAGVELSVFTADCLPVLLYSEHTNTMAAIHAGWRGALQGIVGKVTSELGNPKALHAVIGPALLACCFEVRQDFIKTFEKAGIEIASFLSGRENKTYFDLVEFVVRTQLAHLPEENLHTDLSRCTFCSTPRLPSYRRNGGTDPRLRSWIRRA